MSQFGHPNFRTVHCLPSGMLRENEQTNKKNITKNLIGDSWKGVSFFTFHKSITKQLQNYID